VHDGELTVLSPVGEGTRVTCRLPVPPPSTDALGLQERPAEVVAP